MYVSKVYQYAVDSYGDVRTLVRGLPYQCPDDWEEVLDSLDEDSNLYLVKEPDNPKDKLAIAAYLDDRRIGYVAASDNGKIWLYMTDEKIPCQFIERFEASFKIAFENPRSLFLDMPFQDIYKDKYGVSEEPFANFEIPFLTNPKDKDYVWFDDRTYIRDLEEYIPDFRRKLAARLIILAGRKNSKGEYYYYLPYANNPLSVINDDTIRGLIDKYGFVVALPDVPMKTGQGGIIMDLHVTYFSKTNFKDFDLANQSELVFSLTSDYYVSSQMSAANQTTANSEKHVGSQDVANDDEDMFMQEPQATPSYSKSDYILKKGEVTTSSIDESTFIKIDKIATELYSFVRQTLFRSMELFSYLKKHTPYYNQFYDFGEYETLIKVFVIKDLGRIYKGLNHSVNFDTAEGKVLFLYMEKDTGGKSETSYGAFNELCNPKLLFEAATKMRGVIEKLMKSCYEYDIVLWTDADFIIHSFLKDVNKEWAKRYMELMHQFASAVTGGNEKTLVSSTNSIRESSAIDEFFPLFGITLGKTTWEQVEDMGYKVEIYKDGPARKVRVNNVNFWDDEGEGVFTTILWLYNRYNNTDFPPLWQSKGFFWELSYNEWIALFKKLGFKITVNKEPSQRELSGRNVLTAEFEALSSDGFLLFTMSFDWGENGCLTSSPKSLNWINVKYKGPVTVGKKQVNSGTNEKASIKKEQDGEYYEVSDSPEGGKHVSMGVIVPDEGDEDFDFCSYNCTIRDKDQIDVITRYMKRFEAGNENRPFLMMGRVLFGTSNMYAFYSLDGEIIFKIIFDDKIKDWIKEAGFVLGKVKEYHYVDATNSLNLTLSVSKRKSGEKLFKQASEEAMDYIEVYCSSLADHDVEASIIDAVEKYMAGDSAMSYKVVIACQYGITECKTLDGEDVSIIYNDEIIELAEKNKGVFGHITKVDYDDDGDAWFTIRVSRSIPRLSLESSENSTKNITSAIDEFFPLFGITLGKTTLEQAEGMGGEIKNEGPNRHVWIGRVKFIDNEGRGVISSLDWFFHYVDFPQSWKSKGFSWDNSYDRWKKVFKELGFVVTVTQGPTHDNSSGVSTFKAKFEALSPDGILLFKMYFNNDGGYTSSPKTLETFSVIYKGSASGMGQVNSKEDEKTPEKVNRDEKEKIQEAVFQYCIFDVLGATLTNTPNRKWKYESWNVFGGTYETYVFTAPDGNTGKYKKCEAIVNRNSNTNYKFIGLNVDTVLLLLYHYRRVFDSSYQLEQCKKEYYKILDDSIGSVFITDSTPWLYICRSDGYSIGGSKTAQYDVLLYTSLYNKEYIDKLISQGELITIFK